MGPKWRMTVAPYIQVRVFQHAVSLHELHSILHRNRLCYNCSHMPRIKFSKQQLIDMIVQELQSSSYQTALLTAA